MLNTVFRNALCVFALAFAGSAFAQASQPAGQTAPPASSSISPSTDAKIYSEDPRLFVGLKSAAIVPPGGTGPGVLSGFEIGIAAKQGFGFGVNIFGGVNNPAAPTLGLPRSGFAFGGTADIRYFLQTVGPLSVYPILSVGFLTAQTSSIKNTVIPLVNPGVGARVQILDELYTSLEVGASNFHIPYMAVSLGWSPKNE